MNVWKALYIMMCIGVICMATGFVAIALWLASEVLFIVPALFIVLIIVGLVKVFEEV